MTPGDVCSEIMELTDEISRRNLGIWSSLKILGKCMEECFPNLEPVSFCGLKDQGLKLSSVKNWI
jgi:hypothetical protein